ncbi:alanine--tRNA ligase [Gallionella capsiferriformans]|uniref:Alanine--tRNA ligase n=1 Tax=Gallionella capsiferriformans (strain ES-2) TaxID=395494 RepID=D9SC89_GALCS|nr:alanine--tRNA ligase [Gallionella capsiferriformans]ADL54554.1 alanyl-tRNA synthetase [Gallionella capsiferriformans ES-2]
MKSSEIRQQFLDFFASKGHAIVASSSLVPHDDPTLLFTNAGMNQFKDVFLGFDKRPYVRAASSQKCVRAGGKHNDLENVGYTARHHTFFEMLGNFSFGDYFKRDAISFAWELLTEVFKLPKERLYVTVYAEDDEAYDIWTKEMGLEASRVIRIGDNKGARYASDNFWMMGDTGPCGPCTEIFYDHGEHISGGLPGTPEEDGDRFIEIWNNVFMQFNRDEAGVMHPLPKPSVDTGMGLERISAVLQHVHANYEIDLFQALINAAARETNCSDMDSPSLKVLADHIRACSFLIADGVIPGNEGRGFVLRRIIRRAIRHGYKLGAREAFFYKLVPDLVAQMGVAYPELTAAQDRVKGVLKLEEERFFATIENGMAILEADLLAMKQAGNTVFNGETAFKLHDTFGFPVDLTADVCREHGVTVDVAAFDAAMAQQKQQARAAGKFKMAANLEYEGPATLFHGYETLEHAGCVLALYKDGVSVGELNEGDTGVVVLDNTPFYAESGGQTGDSGELRGSHGIFAVEDTQKIQAAVFGHHGVLKTGKLLVGNGVQARVNMAARRATERNHSVTHLMHKALREVLGAHVQQKGSQVDADKTRFDFVHSQPVTDSEVLRVEFIVNAEILSNAASQSRVMGIEDAQQTGAMMLFGEKYGDEVRVLNIGSSIELCGGTHVARTGDIGLFKIVSESGVAAGVRRIEAVTGEGALDLIQMQQRQLRAVADAVKAQPHEAAGRIAQLLDHQKSLEKELTALKSKLASAQGDELVAQAQDINGVKVLAALLPGADAAILRETLDKLKDKLKSAVILLASVTDGKVALIAGVTADQTAKVKAGELVNMAAQKVGGKGGGRPDMAQAGGTQPEHLAAALASVTDWVRNKL